MEHFNFYAVTKAELRLVVSELDSKHFVAFCGAQGILQNLQIYPSNFNS